MTRPHISINLAISADGKISSVMGIPSGWTSKDDFERLKELRLAADALLIGRGTLEADQMTMKSPQNPFRCVVSRAGRFDASHPLFSSQGGPIHLLGTENPPNPISGTTAHQGSLADFVQTLHRDHDVHRIHCEGGGKLIHELAALNLIDEIHLTWAGHRLFGGQHAPAATGLPGDFLPATRHFELVHFEPREDLAECYLSYQRKA